MDVAWKRCIKMELTASKVGPKRNLSAVCWLHWFRLKGFSWTVCDLFSTFDVILLRSWVTPRSLFALDCVAYPCPNFK
jgi:hypothetical protein